MTLLRKPNAKMLKISLGHVRQQPTVILRHVWEMRVTVWVYVPTNDKDLERGLKYDSECLDICANNRLGFCTRFEK